MWGCELCEVPATGGRRHHYFAAVLRDLAGNVWKCSHQHVEQDEAHTCAKHEYAQQVGSGLIKDGRARGI